MELTKIAIVLSLFSSFSLASTLAYDHKGKKLPLDVSDFQIYKHEQLIKYIDGHTYIISGYYSQKDDSGNYNLVNCKDNLKIESINNYKGCFYQRITNDNFDLVNPYDFIYPEEFTTLNVFSGNEEILDLIYPVGSVWSTFGSQNPNSFLPGDWLLVSGDATITFGDGGWQDGVPVGENDPTTPLPEHTHGVSNITMSEAGEHNHGIGRTSTQTGSWAIWNQDGGKSVRSTGLYSQEDIVTDNADAHTHTLSGTTDSAGSENPTIDVRGSRISINIWRRTA